MLRINLYSYYYYFYYCYYFIIIIIIIECNHVYDYPVVGPHHDHCDPRSSQWISSQWRDLATFGTTTSLITLISSSLHHHQYHHHHNRYTHFHHHHPHYVIAINVLGCIRYPFHGIFAVTSARPPAFPSQPGRRMSRHSVSCQWFIKSHLGVNFLIAFWHSDICKIQFWHS